MDFLGRVVRLTPFADAVPPERAPSSRFWQGRAATLRALPDFPVERDQTHTESKDGEIRSRSHRILRVFIGRGVRIQIRG